MLFISRFLANHRESLTQASQIQKKHAEGRDRRNTAKIRNDNESTNRKETKRILALVVFECVLLRRSSHYTAGCITQTAAQHY